MLPDFHFLPLRDVLHDPLEVVEDIIKLLLHLLRFVKPLRLVREIQTVVIVRARQIPEGARHGDEALALGVGGAEDVVVVAACRRVVVICIVTSCSTEGGNVGLALVDGRADVQVDVVHRADSQELPRLRVLTVRYGLH